MFDHHGLHLGHRQVTLSTAGYLPGLKRFYILPPINLALSLHSPFNEIRSQLIPINKQYPLESVLDVLDQIPLLNKQFITFEYLLIDGLNDRVEDANELYKILHQRKAIINLIPFNPFPGSEYKRPTEDKVEQFKEYLVERKLRTMVRQTKGDDILAACGQLNSQTS
jgi:23S rRNA (adenine2503-C2)-methyltransferase